MPSTKEVSNHTNVERKKNSSLKIFQSIYLLNFLGSNFAHKNSRFKNYTPPKIHDIEPENGLVCLEDNFSGSHVNLPGV